MSFEVFLTDDASRDLEELVAYISSHDNSSNAIHILDKIEETISSLADNPDRGTIPPELRSVGIAEYRELFFKPYRLIFRVIGQNVYIYLIVDGRRDLQTLLEQRLLRV
jgi:toxin ParE1/3/4